MTNYDLGRGVTYHVDAAQKIVWTAFPGGRSMAATREDNAENRAEAADQGYCGTDAVWRSLVEHEALHTLISREVFGTESLVLRHEAGIDYARYAVRLHEEALVLSAQRWRNCGAHDPVWDGRAASLMRALMALDGLGL